MVTNMIFSSISMIIITMIIVEISIGWSHVKNFILTNLIPRHLLRSLSRFWIIELMLWTTKEFKEYLVEIQVNNYHQQLIRIIITSRGTKTRNNSTSKMVTSIVFRQSDDSKSYWKHKNKKSEAQLKMRCTICMKALFLGMHKRGIVDSQLMKSWANEIPGKRPKVS